MEKRKIAYSPKTAEIHVFSWKGSRKRSPTGNSTNQLAAFIILWNKGMLLCQRPALRYPSAWSLLLHRRLRRGGYPEIPTALLRNIRTSWCPSKPDPSSDCRSPCANCQVNYECKSVLPLFQRKAPYFRRSQTLYCLLGLMKKSVSFRTIFRTKRTAATMPSLAIFSCRTIVLNLTVYQNNSWQTGIDGLYWY